MIRVVNLAQVVIHARDFQPLTKRGDHAPLQQVIECGAPQHGLLAARIHRNIAADAARIRTGRVARPHEPRVLGGLHRAAGDDARFALDHAKRLAIVGVAGQHLKAHRAVRFKLLSVDHCRRFGQWNCTAGVTRTAATWNDGQAQFDTAVNEANNLGLIVGMQNNKRIFHAPIGRVGDVRNASEAVEGNVVFVRDFAQHFKHTLSQIPRLAKLRLKQINGLCRARYELADFFFARLAVGIRYVYIAAFLNFTQTMSQRLDQHRAATRVVDQVILQIRIALHHPNVAQHLKQHARTAPGFALAAQRLQNVPSVVTEKPNDDFAI